MYILDIEPSSAIPGQTISYENVMLCPKSSITSCNQKGKCNKHTKLHFQEEFETENFHDLKTLQINQSRP